MLARCLTPRNSSLRCHQGPLRFTPRRDGPAPILPPKELPRVALASARPSVQGARTRRASCSLHQPRRPTPHRHQPRRPRACCQAVPMALSPRPRARVCGAIGRRLSRCFAQTRTAVRRHCQVSMVSLPHASARRRLRPPWLKRGLLRGHLCGVASGDGKARAN
jgi:hypothetical protein